MASTGFYEVSTRSKDHEVRRSNFFRYCQGAGTYLTDRAYVYLKSQDCANIPPATLYVALPDPRDKTHTLSICIVCAVEFAASELEGNVQKYIPVSEEKLRKMKRELEDVLAGLRST